MTEIVEIDWATLDPREIAEAVEYPIEYRDEARKMGGNGRKAALEKYNWETGGKNLLDLYRQVISDL